MSAGSRTVVWVVGTAMGVASLTACGGEDGGGASAGGTIRLAVGRMAAGTDPADDLSSSYLRSYGAAEALLKVQPDGSTAPELAESVERTGPREWTATLRRGAEFWSGAPADADAVAASFERSREEAPLAAGLLEGVEVEPVDARTLRFTTDEPTSFFEYTLASYALVVYNAEAHEGLDPTSADGADLTGPYRLTGFETGRSVSLEAHEGWWGGEPGAGAVEVQLVPDDQSRAEVALSGQADVVQDLPSARASEVRAAGLGVVSEPGATTVAAYLNPASDAAPALADPRVRRALSMAVDRQEVVDLATDGLTEPLPSWLASSPAYPGADEQGWTEPDAEGAAALLDEAGWTEGPDGVRAKAGEPLALRMLTFGAEAATGEVVQAQWADLGVDVALRNVEDSLVVQSLETGDWDVVTQAWTTLGDAPQLLANQVGPGGAANHGEYDVPGVTEDLREADTATTEAERTRALLEVNEAMVETVPLVPLHPRVSAVALGEGVEGFVGHPLQYETIVVPGLRVG